MSGVWILRSGVPGYQAIFQVDELHDQIKNARNRDERVTRFLDWSVACFSHLATTMQVIAAHMEGGCAH